MSKGTRPGCLVIAIDGPSGVGKTTVSRLVAKELALRYVDTGAMYRAVAVKAFEEGIDIEDELALDLFLASLSIDFDGDEARVCVNGEDYSVKIRTPEVGLLASKTSAKSLVRRKLVAAQQEMASGGGVVMEGRDIGTVVLPRADFKFFLDAAPEVRARRRHLEFEGKEAGVGDIGKVENDLAERDKRDRTRKDSPLKPADDAVLIDTGALDIEGVVNKVLSTIGSTE